MGTNWLLLTWTALSLSTELISRVPMLFRTLTAMVLPARSATVLIGELRGTRISWVSACMMEPGASTRKLAWLSVVFSLM